MFNINDTDKNENQLPLIKKGSHSVEYSIQQKSWFELHCYDIW